MSDESLKINPNVLRYIKQHFDTLEAIHEAVRALKPAPARSIPSELMHLIPIGPGTTDVAVRQAGCSEGYWEKVGTFQMERANELEAEVERLQTLVADQALTIGVLKDENGRLTSHAHRQELKWFEEREELVHDRRRAPLRAKAGER